MRIVMHLVGNPKDAYLGRFAGIQASKRWSILGPAYPEISPTIERFWFGIWAKLPTRN